MARSVVLVSLVLASALGAVAEPVAAQDSARTVAAAQQGRNRDLPLDAARNITIDTDEGSQPRRGERASHFLSVATTGNN